MKLTTQQKLQILKDIENNLSLGLVKALTLFETKLDEMKSAKEKEFNDELSALNKKLIDVQLQVKDGVDGESIIGPKGLPGKDSVVAGPKGDKPVAGVDYPIPKNGLPGEGIPGLPGKDGDNGSPDKPEEIAIKLNETTGSVKRKVIMGLEEELVSIKKAIREKSAGGQSGGGMGKVLHEEFSTSSATTTITTVSRIAGNGTALWVFYNGQQLMKGTHYTIGSDQRTITFVITLQDDTKVSVTYIRT